MNGRSFEFELTEEYKKIFAPLTSLLKNNEDKYFVGFRTQPDRMSLYYKGLEMCNFEYKNKNWYANARRLSSTETNKKILNVNSKFIDELLNYGFSRGVDIKLTDNFDMINFIRINKEFVDSYVKIKGIREKCIQQEIACTYMRGKNNILCLDEEYILSDKIRDSKKISGRYDFVFLKKSENGEYEIVPAELKSMKKACIDSETGIMNHFEDMQYFKEEFNLNSEFRNRILDDILFSLIMKKAFGLLDFEIKKSDIKCEIKEWWILFKMSKTELKHEPHVKPQYHKLIEEEFNKKKLKGIRTSLGFRLDEILEKIDTQKAYYLTDDYEFKEI